MFRSVLDKTLRDNGYKTKRGTNLQQQIDSAADDGTITVELQGHCRGCPYSQMTLKNGIERLLKEKIPEVKEVVNV